MLSLLGKLREFYVDVLNDQERQIALYAAFYVAAALVAAVTQRQEPRRGVRGDWEADRLARLIAERLSEMGASHG
jgi:hypothetical protein